MLVTTPTIEAAPNVAIEATGVAKRLITWFVTVPVFVKVHVTVPASAAIAK